MEKQDLMKLADIYDKNAAELSLIYSTRHNCTPRETAQRVALVATLLDCLRGGLQFGESPEAKAKHERMVAIREEVRDRVSKIAEAIGDAKSALSEAQSLMEGGAVYPPLHNEVTRSGKKIETNSGAKFPPREDFRDVETKAYSWTEDVWHVLGELGIDEKNLSSVRGYKIDDTNGHILLSINGIFADSGVSSKSPFLNGLRDIMGANGNSFFHL